MATPTCVMNFFLHKQQNKNIFTRFREKNNNGELLKNVFESNVCKK